MAPSSSSTAPPLMKGYLPVRLKLPYEIDGRQDETFFFIKEHQGAEEKKDQTNSNNNNKKQKKQNSGGSTLFVANAPVIPLVRTRLLLKSLLGRYGTVTRVTVVPNPRAVQEQQELALATFLDSTVVDEQEAKLLFGWTKLQPPSFLAPIYSEGRFAHVVFESNKEMKRAFKALTEIMSKPITNASHLPGISLDKAEIQTLAEASERQYRQEHNLINESDSEDDFIDSSKNQKTKKVTGVLAVAERYRQSCSRQSRAALLEECNRVMEEYEDAEEKDRRAREMAANQPDEDGFVTVSYNNTTSSQIGSKTELEQPASQPAGRNNNNNKGQKRSRKKKKEGLGASELADFYRFQTKEHRKRSLQTLREKFEEDLKKVKKMKEEKQYRPF